MGVDYQLKRGDVLPKAVYMQVGWMIKDLERMRRERQGLLLSPRRHAEARRLESLTQRLSALERALDLATEGWGPKVRRDDVSGFDALGAYLDYGRFCYLLQDPRTGEEPSERTWKRFRQFILRNAAENLYFV